MDQRESNTVTEFTRDHDGAVTVDWIVLTGALVFLGIGASYYVTSSVPKVADDVGDYMSSYPVGEVQN